MYKVIAKFADIALLHKFIKVGSHLPKVLRKSSDYLKIERKTIQDFKRAVRVEKNRS
jgi:hypothetical protein